MKKQNTNAASDGEKQSNKLLTWCLSIFGILVICTILSPPVRAQIYFYEHSNYQGSYIVINQDTVWVGDDFNDKLSSLKVPSGWEVILYEHSNYEGRYLAISQNTPWVGDDFNDLTSSVKIRRIPPPQIAVDIEIVNRTNYQVAVFWINDGEKLYNTLNGNAYYSQPTYATHQWRIKLGGKIVGNYQASKAPSQTVTITAAVIEAGPIWDQADAEQKCNNLARAQSQLWTGVWYTTVAGKMSVCELARLE
jgi:hypothetical protein